MNCKVNIEKERIKHVNEFIQQINKRNFFQQIGFQFSIDDLSI